MAKLISTSSRAGSGPTREHIAEACLQLIRRSGPEAVTMRHLAATMDVSATELYRHFTCKADILASVQAQGVDELERWLADDDEAAPRPERLHRTCLRYIELAQTQPWLYSVIFSSADLELRDAAISVFTTAVRQALDPPPGAVPSEDTRPLQVWVAMHGLAATLVDRTASNDPGGHEFGSTFAQRYVSMVIEGLVESPSPASVARAAAG